MSGEMQYLSAADSECLSAICAFCRARGNNPEMLDDASRLLSGQRLPLHLGAVAGHKSLAYRQRLARN